MGAVVKRLIVLALVLIASRAGAIEISLDAYLDRISESHPLFELGDAQIDLDRAVVERLRPVFATEISLEPYYQYLGETTAFSTYGADFAHLTGVEAGVSRSLQSGATVSSFIRTGYTYIEDELFGQAIGAAFTVPLLSGNRLPLENLAYALGSFDLQSRAIELEEEQEQLLLSEAQLFLDWVRAVDLLEIARTQRAIAAEQRDQTDRMHRSNLVDRIDLLRAQDAVRTADQQVLELEALVRAAQTRARYLTGIDEPIQPVLDLEALPVFDEEALEVAIREGRRFRLLDAAAERITMQQAVRGERVKAQLDLHAAFALSGSDEEVVDSFDVLHPDALVSVRYSRPTSHPDVDAQEREFVRRLELIEAQRVHEVLQLQTTVADIRVRAEELQGVIAVNRRLIESAQERTAEELRAYNQGRGEITFVIQSRDTMQRARGQYLESLARYHRLYLLYLEETDRLFVGGGDR